MLGEQKKSLMIGLTSVVDDVRFTLPVSFTRERKGNRQFERQFFNSSAAFVI